MSDEPDGREPPDEPKAIGELASRVMLLAMFPNLAKFEPLALPDDERGAYATLHYWGTDKSANELGKELDCPAMEIWRLAGPCILVGVACCECGKEPVLAYTRTQAREKLDGKDKCYCESCSEFFHDPVREDHEWELRRLRKMTYREYRQSSHWRDLSAARIQCVGSRCEKCDQWRGGRGIQVHHINFDRRGEELDTDVIALCWDCYPAFKAERAGNRPHDNEGGQS